MANPFLVLGGIAISVATAAFGILQVPGWVAAAQDAAAINDVAQVTQAQAAAMTETGLHVGSARELNEKGSVKTTTSQGSSVYTAVDWTGKHAVILARSASGMYFARLGDRSEVGRGATPSDAVTAAGTTVNRGITAEGIQLPTEWRDGWMVPKNLALHPDGTSLDGYISTFNARLKLVDDFPGLVNTAIHSEPTLAGPGVNARWLEMQVGESMPFGGKFRFTATVLLSEPNRLDFSVRTNTSDPPSRTMPDTQIFLPAGVSRVDLTLDSPQAAATAVSGLTIRGPSESPTFTVAVTQMALTVEGVDVLVPD